MNYLREINAFYDRLETHELDASSIALWHALMATANKAGWPDDFSVSMSVLETKTGLSRKAIERARNLLLKKGYINWHSRQGRQSAVYSLVSLFELSNKQDIESDELSVSQNEPQFVAKTVVQNEPQTVVPYVSKHESDACFDKNDRKFVAQDVVQNVSQSVPIIKLNKTKLNKDSDDDDHTHAHAREANKEIVSCYEREFGRFPNATQIDDLTEFIEKGMEIDLVTKALHIARQNAKDAGYALGILRRQYDRGIKTVAQAELYETERQRSVGGMDIAVYTRTSGAYSGYGRRTRSITGGRVGIV